MKADGTTSWKTVDLKIAGAQVLDGTGTDPYVADVLVDGGRIVGIGLFPHVRARELVDAHGLALAPGFIDMHAHADLSLLSGADADAKLLQGVTCQVIGQDGLGYAPVNASVRDAIAAQITGWNGPLPKEARWETMAQYLDALDRGSATNAVVLVPHGNLRMMVMGSDARRATDEELKQMCSLLDQALLEGGAGLSTGLTYTPASYADTEELVALCKVVAKHDGYFSPHTRSYGKGALESYQEMVDVARHSGVRLHLTHATMNFPENKGRAGELLDLVAQAREEGLQVSLDTYPYTAGATTLSALLPSWAFSDGASSLVKKLAEPHFRARVIHAMDVTGSDGAHGALVDWDAQEISGVANQALEPLVGLSIQQIHDQGLTRDLGIDLGIERGDEAVPAATALDIMVADCLATSILMHVGHEDNVVEMLKDPMHTAGSDGITVGSKPHPRAWGTFAKYLGDFSAEQQLIPLSKMVNHMTSRPARILKLKDRGTIAEGFIADLVLFDPQRVHDKATYEQPKQPATGVDSVWIAGHPVVRGGKLLSTTAGCALRATAP